MDWDNDRSDRKPPAGETLELIEEVWQLRSLTGTILTCGLYRVHGPGVAVRVVYGEDEVYWHRVRDLDAARQEAEEIRQLVLSRKDFTALT